MRATGTKIFLAALLLLPCTNCFCWGFFAHEKINYYAVFLLPPGMISFYKPHIEFLKEHAVDPDKRRYMVAQEGARHYIDIDRYGAYPYDALPRRWEDAKGKWGEDTLQANGIVPWWTQQELQRLTRAFREKDGAAILKYSAELGHYVADAHVPLHASRNHNGQFTGQKGIHAFWESRIPELLAEKEWDFYLGKADYLPAPGTFIWKRVMESGQEADSVLQQERELGSAFRADQKWAFENRNGLLVRQYSAAYAIAYNKKLRGMVERRMRQAIYAVASFWYTAWVNAGQPNLRNLDAPGATLSDSLEFARLNAAWRKGTLAGTDREQE